MKTLILQILIFLCGYASLKSAEPTNQKIKVLYNSLDPNSVSQHLALYELYPNYPYGQRALHDAWKLISGKPITPQTNLNELPTSTSVIASIVALVNKPTDQELPSLSLEDLKEIETLSLRLSHVNLKGHWAQSEEEVLRLPPEEIDLARGLFLSQFGSDILKTKTYEALIDLMALQILARLPPDVTPETKIRVINRFIFDEMGFRFPPHSLYAKDVDLYTFLPSVLDSRRGVCLGVSILYLCIAQRLNLRLEMITPPGHIYIRYRGPNKIINIETTARGIHRDCEDYLGVDTRSLQERNIKEVIGLAHFNQASVFMQQEDYGKTLGAYKKAEPYLKNDQLLKEVLGYAYLFNGQEKEGKELLEQVKDHIPDYAVTKNYMAEDYLNGEADAESLKIIFKHVDETRQSVLEKKQALEKIVKKYPKFKAAILSLAITWLQLHRAGETLETLKYYYTLDQKDPEANYYMAVLYGQRHDFNKSWEHLKIAEKLVAERNYQCKTLKELRKSLALYCPE